MQKKIGILELGWTMAASVAERTINFIERKQYVGVTPQAIAVWCRQLGHEVHYAMFYGNGDPLRGLPEDLDFIFIAGFTRTAALAYALSKVCRRRGTRTVIGGPHAKSFPTDALRYFDLVVLECDKALIADILADRFPLHSVVSSAQPYDDTPTIEERLPELKVSTFWGGRPFPYGLGTIPMLASMGCPYSCNFCVDWRSEYRPLSAERLAEDLRFAAQNLPGAPLMFYDPNFGIRFNEVLTTLEAIPPERRSPFAMESSLTNLRGSERLQRLRGARCFGVAPGIESWTQYSNKVGLNKATGPSKLDQVVEHLHQVQEYVPNIQANLILGIDSDAGDEPFELTQEFIRRTPGIFQCLYVPVPYGGTPLFDNMLAEGRILTSMPFAFYFMPHLTLILKHYDALTYYQKMAALFDWLVSGEMLRRRQAFKGHWFVKTVNHYRTLASHGAANTFRAMARQLESDAELRAFHAGESQTLPAVYAAEYQRQLGPYRELMPLEESRPVLEQAGEPVLVAA